MKKRLLIVIFTALFCASATVAAQDYVNTPVEVSKVKINYNGKTFYSHLVLEKQTLFSICKTYGVSIQDIYDANPDLDIQKNGLKAGSNILIPFKSSNVAEATEAVKEEVAKNEEPQKKEKAEEPEKDGKKKNGKKADNAVTHTVKWYEDLESIAKDYNVSPEAIIEFNELTTTKLEKRQVLRIPPEGYVIPDSSSDTEIVEVVVPVEEEKSGRDAKSYSPEDIIGLNIILPFEASTNPSDRYFDFYSGVLLAAQTLKEKGVSTRINVSDISSGASISDACDIIIGPVSPKDIEAVLEDCPSDAAIISPLDSRVASMVADHPNLIQAPGNTESQTADIISWLKKDMGKEDRIILFSEKGAAQTAIADSLAASGLEYSSFSYGILEGRNVTAALERMITDTGKNRILIASDNEAFVNDVVRNLNLLVFSKHDIVLYAGSKIRSYNTIEAESLHNVNLHSSLSYYVDYDSRKVRKFLLEYRALFCAEPSQYAYQGYDITGCMVEQYIKKGNMWLEDMDGAKYSGLQADYLFKKVEDGGYINRAVRRIIYEKDYSTTLITQ